VLTQAAIVLSEGNMPLRSGLIEHGRGHLSTEPDVPTHIMLLKCVSDVGIDFVCLEKGRDPGR
jgi:hypothetical protein